jgi:hypothetical protein
MKIQLFDDDDLKALEDAIARAVARGLYRAVATLAKNNLWAAPQAQDVAPEAEAPPSAPMPDPEPPPAQVATPKDVADIVARWGRPIAPADDPDDVQTAAPPPPKVHTPIRGAHGAAYAAILSVASHRPDGYVTDEEARDLIDSPTEGSRYEALRRWVLKQEVRAVIVTSFQPSGGLPGRICVHKGDVLERNKILRRRAKIKPGRPGAEPRYDGRHARTVVISP